MLDTHIFFRITETSNKREIDKKDRKDSYNTYEYIPSGKLCFEILNYSYENYARNKWQDKKILRIEDQLNDIIINMIKVATIEKENTAQAKIRHEHWKIEEAKRQEREKLARLDRMRNQNLIKEVERLIKFNQMKEYIEVITTEGKKRLGEDYPGSDFSKWVEWAELFLEKNSPNTWGLPKFELS